MKVKHCTSWSIKYGVGQGHQELPRFFQGKLNLSFIKVALGDAPQFAIILLF